MISLRCGILKNRYKHLENGKRLKDIGKKTYGYQRGKWSREG